MFPSDHWYAILDGRELRRGEVLAARRLGVDLALWRDAAGGVHATRDRCPHRGAALSLGRVRDGCIQCPFHGFRYDGEGRCVEAPCAGAATPRDLAVRAYPLREAHGFVWLWWGEPRGEYPEVPWFPELDASYLHSGLMVREWPVYWMRSVENQLDWPHLPFVHRTTIGFGADKRMEVASEVTGDRLDTWLRSRERPDGTPELKLSLIFPNIWLNPFGKHQIGMVAFAPIDEQRTRMYIRSYQRRLPIPGLTPLLSRLANVLNVVIFGQDVRVVASQPQAPTHETRDERLVRADLPIVQFRREIRRRLRTVQA